MDCVQVTPSIILNNVTPLNIFKLDANFDKSTVGYIIFVFFMLANFQNNQISITMSSINCLNSRFCNL